MRVLMNGMRADSNGAASARQVPRLPHAGASPPLQELASHFHNPVLLSLRTGEGMDDLMHKLSVMLLDKAVRLQLRLPQARMDLVALIHREGKLISQEYDGNDQLITTTVPKRWESKFTPYRVDEAGVAS